MSTKRITVLLILAVIGMIIPFIPYVALWEMFILIIPSIITFGVTLIFLIVSFFSNKTKSTHALFYVAIVPVFWGAQLASCYVVNHIQKARCVNLINELAVVKQQTGAYPEDYDITMGITYAKINNTNAFVLFYSRGFLVTEKYYSDSGVWRNYGWND